MSTRLDIEKVRPYEHLSEVELDQLAGDAAELRLRLAMLSPGEVQHTLVAYGCPKTAATKMVCDPMMRSHAAKFHLDCQDVLLHGDEEARERVEKITAVWERLRAADREREAREA